MLEARSEIEGAIKPMPMILDCDDRDFDLLEQVTGLDYSEQRKKAMAGELKAVRFSTLELLCIIKDCQPGDVLKYESDGTTLSDLTRREGDGR
jgi:DNA-binding Xre family transcriptional regulator